MIRTNCPAAGSYEERLAGLSVDAPHLAHALWAAHEQRMGRLTKSYVVDRLKGLEQLCLYLDASIDAYKKATDLAQLAFLVVVLAQSRRRTSVPVGFCPIIMPLGEEKVAPRAKMPKPQLPPPWALQRKSLLGTA